MSGKEVKEDIREKYIILTNENSKYNVYFKDLQSKSNILNIDSSYKIYHAFSLV